MASIEKVFVNPSCSKVNENITYVIQDENPSEVASMLVDAADHEQMVFDLPRALLAMKTLIAENNYLLER